MKKPLLLVAVLLGVGLTCHAQALSSPAPANRVFTHADTLQALHTLFRTGRTWGKVATALAPVTIGMVAYAGSRMDLGGYDVISGTSTDGNGYAYVAMLGAPVAITLSLVGPLSWKANTKYIEQATIREYEQHLPLSKGVQRRLHKQLGRMLLDTNMPSR